MKLKIPICTVATLVVTLLMMAAFAIAATGSMDINVKNADVAVLAPQATLSTNGNTPLQPNALYASNCRASPFTSAGMCTVHKTDLSPTAVADSSGGSSYHTGKFSIGSVNV